jgi:hypothetical protein
MTDFIDFRTLCSSVNTIVIDFDTVRIKHFTHMFDSPVSYKLNHLV